MRVVILIAIGCVLAVGCGGEDETVIVEPRGLIEALINLAVVDVTETVSVSSPNGGSVFAMVHTGVIAVDGTEYGVEGEARLIALGFDESLRVQWARDYGAAAGLRFAGGVWREPRAVILLAEGELITDDGTITGPAFLPLAFADGVALPALPLQSTVGSLRPRAVAREGEVTVVAGTVRRTVDDAAAPLPPPRNEAWVRRYDGELGGAPAWERTFAAASGEAEIGSADVDSLGNVVLRGRSDGDLADLSVSAGAFLAKLGATVGDPLWVREIAHDPASPPLVVNADDDVILTTTALERDASPESAPNLFAVSGTNGATSFTRTLVSDDTGFFAPKFACAGSNDDAVSVVGEFTGTLRAAGSVATVQNTSVFILKMENDGGTPIFLRWSESSVDVTTELGACDDAGGLVSGGRFQRDTGGASQTLIYFLRLRT